MLTDTETIINPLSQSDLNKKGLCDYVINVATGCQHGCLFCYVPSTPQVRCHKPELQRRGVADPQMDWGNYLFVRSNLPERLEARLSSMRSWHTTPAGKGVVLLCSGTDPYQNLDTARITRQAVEILLKHGKRVRILTRGVLWLDDLDLLTHSNVTIGMSIPHTDQSLSRIIEPHAPSPRVRLQVLAKGKAAGCRVYVAMAPTPPAMTAIEFKEHLERLLELQPEVIFWEPINARGKNGSRMLNAGLDYQMSRKAWAQNFLQQWQWLDEAATALNCSSLIHAWPDAGLQGALDQAVLESWWYRPTVECWNS